MKAKVELTSTETATLLDVHPSTVKRWCNDGELDFDQTPGGHRRIRVDAAVRFARERGIRTVLSPFHPFEPHVWTALRAVDEEDSYDELHALGLHWARRGEFERLEQLYLALGRADWMSFCDFCDHAVRGLMVSVGEEWQKGKLRVGDEHMVSQAITGALFSLRREWMDAQSHESGRSTNGNGSRPSRPGKPVAVVGTTEGNHHQIGALCVRLLLERAGWEVYYPGADVPVEDFGKIQMSREASLVCISLPPSGTIGDVSRTLEVLSEFYDRARPYSVLFGGASYLGLEGKVRNGPFESVAFLQECRTLHDALQEGLGQNGRKS
ncbi:MAG: cobalamin-dependent protein [Longimicrobiales bacterium]|nr:cobalamin-dependent protein [Longimicrobiales bacterium]